MILLLILSSLRKQSKRKETLDIVLDYKEQQLLKIQGKRSKKRKQILQTPNQERKDSYVSERSKTAI